MQAADPARHPRRQDTFDLRDQIHSDDHSQIHAHADASNYMGASDEEHSVLEDDSDVEEREVQVEYMDEDDDGSSSLSIPNESIDFDLVYSLHSFAATVEGQANVVKGDSLFLMDDSNSYWWLVRVLKTQEVGYIPAENIETPFERLARLNKHRNVDLAHPTPQEIQEDVERVRKDLNSRAGSHANTPSPPPGAQSQPISTRLFPISSQSKNVAFTPSLSVHRYPPAVWNEEEEEEEEVEWDDGAYEDEDPELASEQAQQRRMQAEALGMEPDDGMSWDDSVAEEMQARNAQIRREVQALTAPIPASLTSGSRSLEKEVTQQQQSQQQQRGQEAIIAQRQVQQQQQQQQQASLVQAVVRHQASQEDIVMKIDGGPSQDQRKFTATPPPARDNRPQEQVLVQSQADSKVSLVSSTPSQRQDEERKHTREDAESLEDIVAKKARAKDKEKVAPLTTSTNTRPNPSSGGAKLRKERDLEDENKDKKEKKKGGVWGGIFGRKKDKGKDKSSDRSTDGSNSTEPVRDSEESGRSSNQHSLASAETTPPPILGNLSQQQTVSKDSNDLKNPSRQQQQPTPQTPPQQILQNVSYHTSQLRQRDQQQQALYQQYLNRSPSSPPEVQPSYGLQSAPAIMPSSSYNTSVSSAAGLGLGFPSSRPRPGSLVLSPSGIDGQGVGVPELSVIRVFAGNNLQTEATFKTVLLNSLTTSADLVRQSIQRFRLSAGENENDYYLTVKQVEGSSAVLQPGEKPLVVFESLVEAALELPKVKRSSVGSISSVSSNLSMHPAIKKLPMNDFTDDSAVKFYLNRRGNEDEDDVLMNDDGDDTIIADSTHDSEAIGSKSSISGLGTAGNVTSDRFSAPSYKFAMQLLIYADDLPDDMVFDPLTEAIVFKNTLRDRVVSRSSSSSGISQGVRRKIFVFPKNVTVAEVIELGLERFGILEGVVDGGDEVEDKTTKRRSFARLRYGLTVDIGGQERELSPSSKIIDAYPRPPAFRAVERRPQDSKRRSVDSTLLLGSMEDVHPDDPAFVLRRAISYRNSTTRHRVSAPLDEIALQHLRESVSGSSVSSDAATADDPKPRQMSRQELIAAQRAFSRANQRAILTTQANSSRGLDIVLPGNAMIRSTRSDSGDKMRYSYVQDGESYDISDIVEEEWRDTNSAQKSDLLEVVLGRNKDGISEKIDRVLSKIKDGRLLAQTAISQSGSNISDALNSARSTTPSEYSGDEAFAPQRDGVAAPPGSKDATPTQRMVSPVSYKGSRTPTPTALDMKFSRSRTNTPTPTPTPTAAKSGSSLSNRRQPSIVSVMSDSSVYATPTAQFGSLSPIHHSGGEPKPQKKKLFLPKDDFGFSHMMAIIELGASTPRIPKAPLDPVDEMLFGRSLDVNSLHPDIREIYSGAFKQLDEIDKVLDDHLQRIMGGF